MNQDAVVRLDAQRIGNALYGLQEVHHEERRRLAALILESHSPRDDYAKASFNK